MLWNSSQACSSGGAPTTSFELGPVQERLSEFGEALEKLTPQPAHVAGARCPDAVLGTALKVETLNNSISRAFGILT